MNNTFQTIEEFCNLLQITSNCTCDDEELRNLTKMFGSHDICIETSRSIEKHLEYEPTYSRTIAGLVLFITMFGILGNLLVVMVTIKNWRNSIPYQRLIGQLGGSDLLFAILQLWTFFHLFWTNEWVYGETLCKILQGSITLGSFFAVGLIFIISIERYLAIVHPFFWKYKAKKLNYTLSVVNICIGVASVMPRFIYLHTTDENTCTETWPDGAVTEEIAYELYIIVVYFCIPLVVMFYLNFRILYVLRHERMGSADCLRESGKATRKNARTMRILVSIIVAFTVLVMPNRVIMVYFVYKKQTGMSDIPHDVYTILTFVALLPYSFHVTINPILYCIIDKSWRKQAFDLICCLRLFKDAKDHRSSIDGSNVNSRTDGTDATCVKTYHFGSDVRERINTLPVVAAIPQLPEFTMPPPHDYEGLHCSSASEADADKEDYSDIDKSDKKVVGFVENEGHEHENDYIYDDVGMVSSDVGMVSSSESGHATPTEEALEDEIECLLIADPDRETIL